MSLVNDMLRDLDRRKRLFSDSAGSGFRADDFAGFTRQNLKWIFLSTLGVVIAVTAGFMIFNLFNTARVIRNSSEVVIRDPEGGFLSNPVQVIAPRIPEEMIPETNSISVHETDNSEEGFSVSITSPENLSWEIVSRDDYSINVLLHDIEKIESNEVGIGGFSLVTSSAGVSAVIELNQPTEYNVYMEETGGNENVATLVIKAAPRPAPEPLPVTETETGIEAGTVTGIADSPETGEQEVVAIQEENPPQPAQARSVPAPAANANIRTPRELSFEERDLGESQKAAQLIQRGQLMEAYQILLDFINANPEAHRSRETLAKLLFAQQEYVQANAIVDQGLAIAPNYSSYKKIKARLYLLNSQPAEAVNLLKDTPPTIAADSEYYELLATSYQQNELYENAIQTYQRLILQDREVARWWAGMGISHEALGNIDQAVASYQAALQSRDLEPALRQYSQNRIRNLRN